MTTILLFIKKSENNFIFQGYVASLKIKSDFKKVLVK